MNRKEEKITDEDLLRIVKNQELEISELRACLSQGNIMLNQVQQKMNKTKRFYLFISKINHIIVRSTDETKLFKDVCETAVEIGEFKMAWIGKIDQNTQRVIPLTVAGKDDEYLKIINTISTRSDVPGGRGPVGNAVRSGKYIVCNDVEKDSMMQPWKKGALKRGFMSLISIPIIKFGKVIGVFTIYAAEKNFFDCEEIALLDKATSDVAFALGNFEKESMRKKAEEAMFQSEKRYHTLTEVSPVGIFRSDLKGSTTYVNPRWSEISGLSFQQAMGEGWLNAVHPKDRRKLHKGWKEVTNNYEKSITEYRFVKPDGSISWVLGQATPERNAENEIVGYIGTITDITERKKSEEEFKKINKKLEAIIQAIPDMIFEIGLDGVIYNYHSQNLDVLMMPLEMFLGKKIPEVLPPNAAEVCLLALKEASEKGFSIGKQYTLEMPDGKHWYELSIAPINEKDNQEFRFICISRDITEAKLVDEALIKSKERYGGLLNNLDAGIVVHDSDSSIIMCNRKASELLGSSVEDLLRKDAINFNIEFINEDNSIMAIDDFPISQIIQSKQPIKNFVLGIIHSAKRNIVWVLVNGFPMFDEKGEIQEVVISFIDITEQRMMDFEIKKAKEQAEAANKSKTDFLANMSHEIRTPLNGIIGFTSLLMKTNLEENQLEYMSTISESAATLMDIVNDILDLSKIEAGKLELKIEEIDLFTLTSQVIALFKYQANQKNINLVLNIKNDVPQFLYADSLRLKQIIVNLIGNAIKFTKIGEICLDIELVETLADDFSTIHFSVKDSGIGIKQNNQAKIFNSFVQEDNSTSRQFGGTGLGLTISNQLLALMNSKLQLNSTYGVGSDFYFSVTFKNSRMIKALDMKENKVVLRDVEILGERKILIVEDNKINMLLAKTLIKKIVPEGFILEACDGEEAVFQYQKEKPDIIFMDIQMPNKNGFEATYAIRNIEKDSFTPIIALTAGIFVEEKEECLKSGMNDYITKPIIPCDLELMLEKWLKD